MTSVCPPRPRKRSRLAGAVLATLATGALTLGMAQPAAAATDNALEEHEVQQLRTFFDEHGVDAATQDRLIAKFEDGQAWDSFNPDATPVSEETEAADGTKVTTRTYADGSIAVTGAPDFDTARPDDGGASTQSISGCSVNHVPGYATYYNGCHAYVNLGVIAMGFYLDYERINTVGASITSFWGHHHHVVGGSLSNHRLERFSATQVRYSADVSVAFEGFPVGWTAWMQANVSMSNAWTTNN